MVELINTEIGHLQGGNIDVAVFVEVALVVVVREIIMLPVAQVKPTWIELGMWVSSATLLSLAYFLVRAGQKLMTTKRSDVQKGQSVSDQ